MSLVMPVLFRVPLPVPSSPLSIDEATFLFIAIIIALIPLLIWLLADLEARRQRWLAHRGVLRPSKQRR